MIRSGLQVFKGKNILLLQGPVGPFFHRLSKDLTNAGAIVTKINFNGGDTLFYPNNAISFKGSLAEWPAFFEQVVEDKSIDVVLLFGDCRPIHRSVHHIIEKRSIELGVFEEGYVRPDYVTFERHGVNGHSHIPRDPAFYYAHDPVQVPATVPVGNTFKPTMGWAMSYYMASAALQWVFPKYAHHRPLSVVEALPWVKSYYRKLKFAASEKHMQPWLTTELSGRFYLVPLQVHNDAQISSHSGFKSVEAFIVEVMQSFAKNAPTDTVLVIKHHPMDRGYHDYTAIIKRTAGHLDVQGRVFYIHDQHLPTLLDHARGVVLINSTVGLQALHHSRPLKVCGNALYDMDGLTYQKSLDSFWHEASSFTVNMDLYERFRCYMIDHTQFNGSFYKRCVPGNETGLVFSKNNIGAAGSVSAEANCSTISRQVQ